MTVRTRILGAGMLASVLAGCAVPGLPGFGKRPPAGGGTAVPATAPTRAAVAAALDAMANPGPRAAGAGGSVLNAGRVTVDLYVLSVPFGTVSRNTAFWKRVSEDAIDVGPYDVLQKNGLRVGLGSVGDWDYFKRLLAEHPAVNQQNTLVANDGGAGKSVDLPLRKQVDSQMLFYFDAGNQLVGRSFDRCENFVTLTFQPAPRKANTVRAAICPVVRSLRTRIEYTPMDEELEISYVRPQALYDLNLTADVPLDSFLVVAPSESAARQTSFGHLFFVQDGAAEQSEMVLLLVPRTTPGRSDEITPAGIIAGAAGGAK